MFHVDGLHTVCGGMVGGRCGRGGGVDRGGSGSSGVGAFGCVGRGEVNGHGRVVGRVGCPVDRHGDSGVVVLHADEFVPPEFSTQYRISIGIG